MRASRSREVWRGLLGGFCVAVVGYHVTLAAIAAIATAMFGGSAFVIAGESMEPALHRGAIVVDRPIGESGVAEGDIVTFRSSDQIVTHRVLAVTPEGIQTQGDNNRSPDSTLLTTTDLLGQTGIVVPYLGWPRLWLGEGSYLPLAVWLGVIALSTAGAIQFREGREVKGDQELAA